MVIISVARKTDEVMRFMSMWSIMNWVAWGGCGILTALLLSDFIKVEREMAKKDK